LAAASVPFDVVLFPDGVTAPDRVVADSLTRDDTVVLPDCAFLTSAQAAAVGAHLAAGGCVVVTDRFADNLPADERRTLLSAPGLVRADATDVDALLPLGRQVEVGAPVGVNIHGLPDGAAAVHLVNFDYDEAADRVETLDDVALTVRLGAPLTRATLYGSDGDITDLDVKSDEASSSVRLDRLGLYGIVVFHDESSPHMQPRAGLSTEGSTS
ncbi:MAG: hypothetical protein QOD35_3117, partial [Nocardioidaceae bacterium]|nr:hypothetical protein [Nocardioidaceae bacterium]